MAMSIQVCLSSGRCIHVRCDGDSRVGFLKTSAQQQFGKGFLKLISSDGGILDPTLSLRSAGLKDGDTVSAVAQTPCLAATREAFALWCPGGGVATWGNPNCGGQVPQLNEVLDITGSFHSFAAVLRDGGVATWGTAAVDAEDVTSQLSNVRAVRASGAAFAAILADGHVKTWGDPIYGGDSSLVADLLHDVVEITGSEGAFAARRDDGSVVTWGHVDFGGDSSPVQAQLLGRVVVQVQASEAAFAALTEGGFVVAWGHGHFGGDSSSVQVQLQHITSLHSTCAAFAAVAGSYRHFVCWGATSCGGSAAPPEAAARVVEVKATDSAFAARLEDGTLLTWGVLGAGGDAAAAPRRAVARLAATGRAFAAVLVDGTVECWGDASYGGDCSSVAAQLFDVVLVAGSHRAFSALRGDGRLIAWGDGDFGGHGAKLEEIDLLQ